MTRVITIAQQKGGAGKTMLAANLAAWFAASGRRVAVVDIDPQRSLARWHAIRAERDPAAAAVTLCAASGWRIPAELDRLRRTHDAVLIDSPPQVDTDARVAVRAADLVLIPLQPSPPDLWAAYGTIALAAAERRAAAFVLNRAPAASKLRTQVEREIAAGGTRLLAAALGSRAAFANAFAMGLGVAEAWPRSPAAAEVAALAEEVDGA